jgi:hypothetical protein
MAALVAKSFEAPDEVRSPEKTRLEVVDLGTVRVGRLRIEPGWRWSECIKPVVGGDSCQAHHVGVLTSGTMHVVHDDGQEADVSAGSAYVIEPGHDAWVVGDEAVVGYEFDSATAESYARPT